jgi:hypothetical protein
MFKGSGAAQISVLITNANKDEYLVQISWVAPIKKRVPCRLLETSQAFFRKSLHALSLSLAQSFSLSLFLFFSASCITLA